MNVVWFAEQKDGYVHLMPCPKPSKETSVMFNIGIGGIYVQCFKIDNNIVSIELLKQMENGVFYGDPTFEWREILNYVEMYWKFYKCDSKTIEKIKETWK